MTIVAENKQTLFKGAYCNWYRGDSNGVLQRVERLNSTQVQPGQVGTYS